MRTLIQEIAHPVSLENLVGHLRPEPGRVLLRSGTFQGSEARYSFVAARPFLTLRSSGSRCELRSESGSRVLDGNPWRVLADLMARCELREEADLPFPLGGCFGYWGYDLKNFIEPKLPQRAGRALALPDGHFGFYDSLIAIDHQFGKTWIISTGLREDGSRSAAHAQGQMAFWRSRLNEATAPAAPPARVTPHALDLTTTLPRPAFLAAVKKAQAYIRAGDIYQVNLSQRLATDWPGTGWEFYERLAAVSPAPFAAFLDGGDFQIASSSPELFLRMSGSHITTRPIKGTRPRSADPTRDAQLAYELQTSPKENAELVMITDLLRNDLGRVCEFGSIHVPDLLRLERFAQVHHLVSTVEGRLREGVAHLDALAACFPGGSITGAPKIRAMQIIDELEPVARGPYTGALGYLGFNRESQLNILIRTAVIHRGQIHFAVGAGIVADSTPEAEYAETLAKAGGFLAALRRPPGHGRSDFSLRMPSLTNP